MRTSAPPRVAGLDGLRALHLWIVIGAHSQVPWLSGGAMAVDVFFVISGFLITHLLLAEHAAHGRIDLGRFWGRRALRLLPALVVVVLLVDLAALLVVRDDYSLASVAATPYVLGYVGNWLIVATHSPALGWFGPTWSLSVEEQFYLLWPLAVPFLVRTSVRTRAVLIAAAIAVSLVLRFAFLRIGWENQALASLPVNAYALLAGCALALLVQSGRTALLRRITPALALPALAYLLLVCGLVPEFGAPGSVPVLRAYWTAGMPLVGLASAVLVAHCWLHPGRALSRLLSARPLAATGRISYGMYLWHYPVIMVLLGVLHEPPPLLLFALALPATYAAGLVSWFVVERPLQRRFRAGLRPRALAEGPGVGHRRAEVVPERLGQRGRER